MSQGSDARGGLCREKTEQKQIVVDQAGWVHTVPRLVSTWSRVCSLAPAEEFAVNICSGTRASHSRSVSVFWWVEELMRHWAELDLVDARRSWWMWTLTGMLRDKSFSR